jgi:hypothetical protein
MGKYEQLDYHLKKCLFVPTHCLFSVHGCEFIGNKRSLDEHYNNNNHLHNVMLSTKIMSLENSMKLDQVVISQLKQRVVDTEDRLRRAKRTITTIKDSTNVRIHWIIDTVSQKICDKPSALSDSFYVATPKYYNDNNYYYYLYDKKY